MGIERRCHTPSSSILYYQTDKSSRAQSLIFPEFECASWGTSSIQRPGDAPRMLTRTLRGFTQTEEGRRGEGRRKQTEKTYCLCDFAFGTFATVSPFSWFKVIILQHLILGMFSAVSSWDSIQFSKFCWSALFHRLWLLEFIYNNSRWGAKWWWPSQRIPDSSFHKTLQR